MCARCGSTSVSDSRRSGGARTTIPRGGTAARTRSSCAIRFWRRATMALDEAALETLGLATLWVRRGAPVDESIDTGEGTEAVAAAQGLPVPSAAQADAAPMPLDIERAPAPVRRCGKPPKHWRIATLRCSIGRRSKRASPRARVAGCAKSGHKRVRRRRPRRRLDADRRGARAKTRTSKASRSSAGPASCR